MAGPAQFAIVVSTQQDKHNNKFSVTIRPYYKGDGGNVVGLVTSGAVFSTAEEAREGGERACKEYEQFGMFPNMSEYF